MKKINEQEQINDKTISIAIRSTKLTGRILAKALNTILSEMKKQKLHGQQPKSYQGKQSLKNLVKQGTGVSNIEITDKNIKSFERVARKYGVDFSLKKDSAVTPPKWLVFFKGRDADVITAAFNEYSAKTLKKSTDKPSILVALRKMKELSASLNQEKVKNKVIER